MHRANCALKVRLFAHRACCLSLSQRNRHDCADRSAHATQPSRTIAYGVCTACCMMRCTHFRAAKDAVAWCKVSCVLLLKLRLRKLATSEPSHKGWRKGRRAPCVLSHDHSCALQDAAFTDFNHNGLQRSLGVSFAFTWPRELIAITSFTACLGLDSQLGRALLLRHLGAFSFVRCWNVCIGFCFSHTALRNCLWAAHELTCTKFDGALKRTRCSIVQRR